MRNVCTEAGMAAIRAERDYAISEDIMKVRAVFVSPAGACVVGCGYRRCSAFGVVDRFVVWMCFAGGEEASGSEEAGVEHRIQGGVHLEDDDRIH